MLNLYTYALDNEKKLATESVNVPKIVKNESVFENMVNARLLDSFANVNTVARANYAAAIDTLEKAIKENEKAYKAEKDEKKKREFGLEGEKMAGDLAKKKDALQLAEDIKKAIDDVKKDFQPITVNDETAQFVAKCFAVIRKKGDASSVAKDGNKISIVRDNIKDIESLIFPAFMSCANTYVNETTDWTAEHVESFKNCRSLLASIGKRLDNDGSGEILNGFHYDVKSKTVNQIISLCVKTDAMKSNGEFKEETRIKNAYGMRDSIIPAILKIEKTEVIKTRSNEF